MKPEKKQILDLADEFLADVATSFFDARCQLDAMIETFEAAVAQLRREAGRVTGAAAVLRTALITDAAVEALFHELGVDAAPFATGAAPEQIRWIRVPSLWGRRRRYRAVVGEAYRRLAAAVSCYQDGPSAEAGSGEDDGAHAIYYRLLEEMARLINDRIAAVNRRCVPSEMLQYVKQFDPAKVEREGITGGGGGNGGIDDRLCYLPLDFPALQLPVFPRLPPPQEAREALCQAADAVYRDRPEAVACLLEEFKRRQANWRPASGPGATP
jgi:hypothetical protein